MRRLTKRLCDERGIALMMALGMMMVISVSVTSAIYYTSQSAKASNTSRSQQIAFGLAEAGINNAMSVLANPANNAMDNTLLPARTSSYEGGTVTWSGTLDSIAAVWTLTSTGTTRQSAAATGINKRTLSAKVPVYPSLAQPLNNPSWNYVYSRGTGATCDTTLANSVNVQSPFFVEGNLCLQNTAKISAGPTVVGGRVTMNQNSNQIGAPGAPISELQVADGCKYTNAAVLNPCRNGAGNAGNSNVWASVIKSTADDVAPPVPLWDDWYANASPGPSFPCTQSSGVVPVFDNDALQNNSVPGVFHLTPGTSYSCKTAMGEISWNATTKVLTISGTIFIDGSAKIENGSVNIYEGYATLYLSGTLLIKNSRMCALVAGSLCTTANWDPNSKMLVVVVNGKGGQLSTNNGIELVSAGYQGALYATWGLSIGTTSDSEGPLNGRPVILGQTAGSEFPPFSLVPAGMPGNPAVYAQPAAPQSYSG